MNKSDRTNTNISFSSLFSACFNLKSSSGKKVFFMEKEKKCIKELICYKGRN